MRQQPTDEANDGFVDKRKGKYVILEVEGHSGPQLLAGLLDFVLRALWALRPSDPRNDALDSEQTLVLVLVVLVLLLLVFLVVVVLLLLLVLVVVVVVILLLQKILKI